MRSNTDGRPWYREPWPWILIAPPALAICSGIAMLTLAIKSNDGLVAGDYYKEGLAVNQRLQREQRAQELGVRAELMRSGQQLRLMLTNGGAEITGLSLKILHPTRPGNDQIVELRPQPDGLFTGELAGEVLGRRYVMLEDPAGIWRLQGEWVVEENASLRLLPGETAAEVKSLPQN